MFFRITLLLGSELAISSIPNPRKDIEAKRIGSINRLRSIGWKPSIGLEEGIRKTWEWINDPSSENFLPNEGETTNEC